MKLLLYLTIAISLISCVSNATPISPEYDKVSDQIYAYEQELKALSSFEIALQQYRQRQISHPAYMKAVKEYFDVRNRNRAKGLEVAPGVTGSPYEEEFRSNESFLLDALYILRKKRTDIVKEEIPH